MFHECLFAPRGTLGLKTFISVTCRQPPHAYYRPDRDLPPWGRPTHAQSTARPRRKEAKGGQPSGQAEQRSAMPHTLAPLYVSPRTSLEVAAPPGRREAGCNSGAFWRNAQGYTRGRLWPDKNRDSSDDPELSFGWRGPTASPSCGHRHKGWLPVMTSDLWAQGTGTSDLLPPEINGRVSKPGSFGSRSLPNHCRAAPLSLKKVAKTRGPGAKRTECSQVPMAERS